MAKVKITVTESRCRDGSCQKGDVFLVEGLCPPLCHELWNSIYPQVFALLNGAGRVKVHGEVAEDEADHT